MRNARASAAVRVPKVRVAALGWAGLRGAHFALAFCLVELLRGCAAFLEEVCWRSDVVRVADAKSVDRVPDIRAWTVLRQEVAKICERVPELADWAVLGLENVAALNNVPDMLVIDGLEPVALARAKLIVPVLRSLVSVRARANWDALARA